MNPARLLVPAAALASTLGCLALTHGGGTRPRGTGSAQLVGHSESVSAALGRDLPGYGLGGTIARNPAQGLTARFGARSVDIHASKGRAAFGLFAINGRRVSARRAERHPTSVAYGHGAVTERWQNSPLGLEQTFTIPHRLSGERLRLTVGRGARARMQGTSVLLGGGLRYTALRVTDARGHVLPAHLSVARNRVAITSDMTGARYPVTVDPLVETARLTPSGSTTDDLAGYSVAISGNTAAVGAPYVTVGGTGHAGAVYVYQKGANGWAGATQVAKLTPSDPGDDHRLGFSVAVQGDTIVAGAPDPDRKGQTNTCPNMIYTGQAYVFVKPPGGWTSATESAKLTPTLPSDPTHGYCGNVALGFSVAISGDTVVAGALEGGLGDNQRHGSAFVFPKPAGGWTGTVPSSVQLHASDAGNDPYFGWSVAISGDTIVAGAPVQPTGSYYGEGRAYIFTKPAGGWATNTENAELKANDLADDSVFGSAVALDGDTLAVGAPRRHTPGPGEHPGAVYVFTKPASGWATTSNQTSELAASDAGGLGTGVSVSGTNVLAATEGESGTPAVGAVYLFSEPAGGWPATMTPTQELQGTPAGSTAGTGMAHSAAIDGTTAIAGAPGGRSPNDVTTGLAYVFEPGASPGPSPTPTGTTTPPPGTTGPGTAAAGKSSVHGTTASVPLKCAGATGAACVLKLKLTATTKKHHKKVKVTVGGGSVTLAAPASKTVKLKLNKAGRALLKHVKKLHVTLTVSLGTTKVATSHLTFKRAKHKKHKKH